MSLDPHRELRILLTERDLVKQEDGLKSFYLDLNQGGIRLKADAGSLRLFAQTLMTFCKENEHSEIGAIIQLVAARKDFYQMQDRIYWHRSYHVDYAASPEKWVTFGEYLLEFHGIKLRYLSEMYNQD